MKRFCAIVVVSSAICMACVSCTSCGVHVLGSHNSISGSSTTLSQIGQSSHEQAQMAVDKMKQEFQKTEPASFFKSKMWHSLVDQYWRYYNAVQKNNKNPDYMTSSEIQY
jgi:hypothetical protein